MLLSTVFWSVLSPSILIIEVSDLTVEVTFKAKKSIERMETDDGPSSQQLNVKKKYEVVIKVKVTETQDSYTTNIISCECDLPCIASWRVLPPCTLITEISDSKVEVSFDTKKSMAIERMETDDGSLSQHEVAVKAEVTETQDSCFVNIISFN